VIRINFHKVLLIYRFEIEFNLNNVWFFFFSENSVSFGLIFKIGKLNILILVSTQIKMEFIFLFDDKKYY
jgi:hypothetical protein